MSGLLMARVAFFAVLAGLAFPSDGAADGNYVYVALTATGPSPSTATMYPISDLLVFVNQDTVAHTIVFADGDCSLSALNIPPGEQAHCSGLRNPQLGTWPSYVGSYAYTVDGKFSGTVKVVGFPRSVSLTARTHTIRLGSKLKLHGQLTLTNRSGGPELCAFSGLHVYSPVVRVLARHDRNHRFHRIAMFALRQPVPKSSSYRCNYAWQLKVRPGLRTTYIADSRLSADLWKPATSRTFTVRVRN